jgi:hypothetical protein
VATSSVQGTKPLASGLIFVAISMTNKYFISEVLSDFIKNVPLVFFFF